MIAATDLAWLRSLQEGYLPSSATLITLAKTITHGEVTARTPTDLRTLPCRVRMPSPHRQYLAGQVVIGHDVELVLAYDADLSGTWDAVRVSEQAHRLYPVGDRGGYSYQTIKVLLLSELEVGQG